MRRLCVHVCVRVYTQGSWREAFGSKNAHRNCDMSLEAVPNASLKMMRVLVGRGVGGTGTTAGNTLTGLTHVTQPAQRFPRRCASSLCGP